MFITSLVVYIISKKITQSVEPQVENGEQPELTIRENGGENTEEIANAIVEDAQRQKNAAMAAALVDPDNNKPNFDGLIKICKFRYNYKHK